MKQLLMFRYYCRAVFVPAIPSILLFGFILFYSIFPYNGPTEDESYGLIILLFSGHALYFCLAALPILLNRYRVVWTNRMLSSLTWLLLPLGLICVLLVEGFISDITGQGFPYLLFAGCDLVYMVGLLMAHARFRREQVRLAM